MGKGRVKVLARELRDESKSESSEVGGEISDSAGFGLTGATKLVGKVSGWEGRVSLDLGYCVTVLVAIGRGGRDSK